MVEQAENLLQAASGNVKCLGRALELVRFVSLRNAEGARLCELATDSSLAKPTVHRLLAELVSAGLLMRDKNRYRLGQLAFELGITASAHFHLREVCHPSVVRLAEAANATVYLSMRSGGQAFCVDMKTSTEQPWMKNYGLGSRVALGTGACSLALLSFAPDIERDLLIETSEPQLPSFGRSRATSLGLKVQETRALGFATTENDVVDGVSAIGVPIFDKAGKTIAAISIADRSSKMTRAYRAQITEQLRSEASRLGCMITSRASYGAGSFL